MSEIEGMISVSIDGVICDNANNEEISVLELANRFNTYSKSTCGSIMKYVDKIQYLKARLKECERVVDEWDRSTSGSQDLHPLAKKLSKEYQQKYMEKE